MRGRNNNNRKGPNPLTRSYESNGPDVKIRGSAQQIADKYAALARDAQSAGDRVMAENYLQHAEHYNRIIAAAQAQMQPSPQRDGFDDGDDERDATEQSAQPSQTPARNDGSGPQPVIDGTPAEVALEQESMPASNTGSKRGKKSEEAKPAEASDGDGSEAAGASGEEETPAPRRARRPRRSRKTASEGGEEGSEQPAPKAQDDAAKSDATAPDDNEAVLPAAQ